MDAARKDANGVFTAEKAALVKGLTGIRKALQILGDYFGASASLIQQPAQPAGHQADAGAGGSIISILEVAESDMATELVKVETQEADEAAAYEEMKQGNKMTNLAKSQD